MSDPRSDKMWAVRPHGGLFGQNGLQMASKSSHGGSLILITSWARRPAGSSFGHLGWQLGLASFNHQSGRPPTAEYFLPVTWIIFNQMGRMLNRRDDGIYDAADPNGCEWLRSSLPDCLALALTKLLLLCTGGEIRMDKERSG